jgi:hypothetical protein
MSNNRIKAPYFRMGPLFWRLDRVSQRTIFWFYTTIKPTKPKRVKKTFRNPIIQAKEMKLEMEYHNLTKALFARKLNISRTRVTQMLSDMGAPHSGRC